MVRGLRLGHPYLPLFFPEADFKKQELGWAPVQTSQMVVLRHPVLKGFGISMLFSIIYAWVLIFGPFIGALADFTLIAFVPIFLLLNSAVALNYRRHGVTGIRLYALGATMAFVFDVLFVAGVLFLVLAYLF